MDFSHTSRTPPKVWKQILGEKIFSSISPWKSPSNPQKLDKIGQNSFKKIKLDKKVWKLDPRPPTPPWKSTLLKKCGFGVDPPPVWKKSTLFIFFFLKFIWHNMTRARILFLVRSGGNSVYKNTFSLFSLNEWDKSETMVTQWR